MACVWITLVLFSSTYAKLGLEVHSAPKISIGVSNELDELFEEFKQTHSKSQMYVYIAL